MPKLATIGSESKIAEVSDKVAELMIGSTRPHITPSLAAASRKLGIQLTMLFVLVYINRDGPLTAYCAAARRVVQLAATLREGRAG